MTTLANLENSIKHIKDLAKSSKSFTEFFNLAHQWYAVNPRAFVKNEFDRLVSVASVEAGLENTD